MNWKYREDFLKDLNKKNEEPNNYYDLYDYKNWLEKEVERLRSLANGVITGEKQCNLPVVSKFNFIEFKNYVDTYDPKRHGLNKPDIIVKDLLYGIGVSIDKKFSCFDGFKKFIEFVKANF
jgi:hypothetical protein